MPRLFPKSERSAGFSLVEAAIILVVLGLIAGTVTPLIVSQIKREKLNTGRDVVRLARDELIGFVQSNDRLPTDITDIGHSTDPWAKTLFYKPANGTTSPGLCAALNGTSPPQGLELSLPSGDSVSGVAFLVGSTGEDHRQGTELNATPIVIEAYNEDLYDDIVEFTTLDYLKGLACDHGGSGGGGDQNSSSSKFAVYSSQADLSVPNQAQLEGSVSSGGDITLENQAEVTGDVLAQGSVRLIKQSEVGKDICSSGDVVLENQTTVNGDINAQGDIVLGNEAHVLGDIYSGNDISIDNGAHVEGEVNAQGETTFLSKGDIDQDTYSNEDLTLVNNSRIGGNAHCFADIYANFGSKIGGNAYASGAISVHTQAEISGSVNQYASSPPLIQPTEPKDCLTVESINATQYSADTQDISLSWNEDQHLTPGSYQDLSLGGKNILYLDADASNNRDFFFKSIDIDWDSDVYIDLSVTGQTGELSNVNIFVVEEVDIDGKFDIYVSTDGDEYEKYNNVASLNAAYIYLECHDNFSLGSQSNWYGTIFSDQDISFSDSINLVGSYYTNGDTIFLGNAINITYVQSNYAKENW